MMDDLKPGNLFLYVDPNVVSTSVEKWIGGYVRLTNGDVFLLSNIVRSWESEEGEGTLKWLILEGLVEDQKVRIKCSLPWWTKHFQLIWPTSQNKYKVESPCL